ncbi:PaaI family thioesterase [Trichloromonas sp.]|uniref:PaaI family thioesterase n=1 Tax=Trichloromonas sp. TaxID=3069249 RepID=UPI003D81BB73
MLPNTHLSISSEWVGEPVSLSAGRAVAQLKTRPEMIADERGLVHGGFTFGLADYAAMLAVNDPCVVLGSAEARFVAPVRIGDIMVATAEVVEESGKKRQVKCTVSTTQLVFEATFTCFVLPKHILES